MRRVSPCPASILKLFPEVDPPVVYKLSLFGQSLGFFFLLHFPEFVFELGRSGGDGEAERCTEREALLDLCGQLGYLLCPSYLYFEGRNDPSWGQEGPGAGGMLSLGLRPASSTHRGSWGI